MIAAIYARKSTEQNGVADEERSVTRQIEHATAFAEHHGWRVAPEHIYVDDGISGAIFDDGRPGLMRLLNALRPRPAFDVLIMSEESRLGREMTQTSALFGEMIRAGVRVWFYLDDRERKLETAIDKMMLSLTTFGAELEREKARQRTRDAMLRKAKAGHVCGGRVFGYDNIRIDGHVERRVNEDEAAVIRRIFELAALGHGLRTIAHSLNADGHSAPRPQRGRPKGWSPTTIRDVLRRPIYRGVAEWDRFRRNNERRQLKRHANTAPLRIEAPHLRIISEELAATADGYREDRRERYLRKIDGRLMGGPAPRAVKHVLSGLLRCACGATFEAQSHVYGRRKGGVYVCSAARRKGRSVCANDLHLPIADTEARILDEVERALLDADVFSDAIDVALERVNGATTARTAFIVEQEQLDRELAKLAEAITIGGDMPSLIAQIQIREARKREIARLTRMPVMDRNGLRAALEAKLDDWKRLLRSRPTHGQRVLRTLLHGSIMIGTPTAAGVPWEANGDLSGVLGTLSHQLASPAGFEPALPA
jgi:site-specific DNA recombinase